MKKKKKLTIILVTGFILITGILYTVFYVKPWDQKAVLLEGGMTEEKELLTENHCADESEEATAIQTKEESNAQTQIGEPQEKEQTAQTSIFVHICGEVNSPGVYEVDADSRLTDVIEFAGGMTEKAASDYVNLAQKLQDGQKYYIPNDAEIDSMQKKELLASTVNANEEEDFEAENEPSEQKININRADRDELMTLPGVGEAKADSIIQYRENVGSYETIEDVMKVNGIKEGLFQKISSRITV